MVSTASANPLFVLINRFMGSAKLWNVSLMHTTVPFWFKPGPYFFPDQVVQAYTNDYETKGYLLVQMIMRPLMGFDIFVRKMMVLSWTL